MNVLSIDLESWVHKYFFDSDSSIKNDKDDGHICDATQDALKILEEHGVKTTFFVVSEIFDWYPWLVHEISKAGHEIAFHTVSHRRLHSKKHLVEELEKGKKFIEEFDTRGFRAPEALIKKEHFSVLKDWGFTYDSSVYSEFRIWEPIEEIYEVAVSTYPLIRTSNPPQYPRNLTFLLLMREIPFGSGYFIGLLGQNVKWFIEQVNNRNIPANLFVHTWQLKDEPREAKKMRGNFLRRAKMIPYNIKRRDTVDFLYSNFDFIPMIELINRYHLGR